MLRVSFLGRLRIAALALVCAPWATAPAQEAPAKTTSKDKDIPLQSPDSNSQLCPRAQVRAREILAVLDAKASPAVKAFATSILAEAGTTARPDVPWDEFAGIAYLKGNPDTALWAEVHALALNGRAEYAGHAGVYLLNLKNLDDAKLFLHCANDMGWRSASLFEALALAYDTSQDTKDKDKAKQYIDQAQSLNPGDLILQAESSLITTGTLPPIPPRKKDDLDPLLDDLERHFRDVNSRLRAAIQLLDQIGKIVSVPLAADYLKGQDRWEADMRKQLDSIRQVTLPLARISLEEFRKTRFPKASVQLHQAHVTYFRDMVINQWSNFYMDITIHEIQSSVAFLNYGFWNMDLWARAMHTDVLSYVRQGQATKTIAVAAGIATSTGGPGGFYLDPGESGAARYAKAYREADEIERRYTDRHAARVAWCAHLIPAYQDWQASAKSDFQVAADGFNTPAKQLLAWGGAQVAGARGFLVRAMRVFRPVNYTPTGNKGEDAIGQSWARGANSFPQSLNTSYRRLIDLVAGNPENIFSVIPNSLLYNKKSFAVREQNSETALRSASDTLNSLCSLVAAEVFKKLNGDETDATREELFNELVESLDAKLDPTSKCEYSLGKFASAHIEFDWEKSEFHTEAEVKWDFKEATGTKGQKEKLGNWTLSGGATAKYDSHGDPIETEATVGGDVEYDILTGYGEVGIVAERDPATGTWKRMAEVKSSVGLGVGSKEHLGEIACYPAELTMKFDPREVMQKAVRFLGSLDSRNQ